MNSHPSWSDCKFQQERQLFKILVNCLFDTAKFTDFLTEHLLDLFTDAGFIKVGAEDVCVGEDRPELVCKCFWFADFNILEHFLDFLIHRVRGKLECIAVFIDCKHISEPACDCQRDTDQCGSIAVFLDVLLDCFTKADTDHL